MNEGVYEGMPGLNRVSAPMFKSFVSLGDFEPSPEDMEAAAKQVAYNKYVKVTGYYSRTYDLSKKAENTEFEQTIMDLYLKVVRKEVYITCHERHFIPTTGSWVAHLEWYTLTLEERKEGDTKNG